MTQSAITIEAFDPATASESEFRALLAFTNQVRAELMPDDPPTALDEAIAAWRGASQIATVSAWLARAGNKVVGRGQLTYPNVPENRHLVQAAIQVASTHRRQGLARQLLARMAAKAREAERTLLIGYTLGRVPAGAAFLSRLGGERGLEAHEHQLVVAELDRECMREWQARAQERAAEFETGFWDGAFPEADLVAIAALHDVMNTQPTGSLAIEHQHYTPELLRKVESALALRGAQRIVMYARARASGRLAGFTELYRRPSDPTLLTQGNTGVMPELRDRGLGRWLKAGMLARVLAGYPEVRFVRTSNADSNAAMLKLNHELGFRPYVSRTVWQVSLAQVESYLGSS